MVDPDRGVNFGRSEKAQLPTRRSFLSSATAMGAVAVTGGLWLPTRSDARTAGNRPPHTSWTLEAVRVEKTFSDGTTVPLFRFRAVRGTPSTGQVPLLAARELTLATLVIHNRLAFPIQPQIVDFDTGPVIEPGQTGVMTLLVPPAGTYLLTDALLGPVAGPIGLGAMLISRRSLSSDLIYPEYVLLYQDIDDRWNFDIDGGFEPDVSVYEPNFHIVNGLTFPDLASDPDTRIVCEVGQTVALRLGNLGHVRQSLHFHGYHVKIVARNNVPETMLPMKDTIGMPGYSTLDLVLPVDQPGVYPVHPHSLTTVTDNGLYPHGQLLLIEAI